MLFPSFLFLRLTVAPALDQGAFYFCTLQLLNVSVLIRLPSCPVTGVGCGFDKPHSRRIIDIPRSNNFRRQICPRGDSLTRRQPQSLVKLSTRFEPDITAADIASSLFSDAQAGTVGAPTPSLLSHASHQSEYDGAEGVY